MRANNDVEFAVFQFLQNGFSFFCCAETVEIINFYGHISQTFRKSFKMLKGQNGGWDQNCDLLSVVHRFKSRANSDFRFSETYVATDQAVHRALVFHIFFYVFGRRALVRRIFINKRRFQFGL